MRACLSSILYACESQSFDINLNIGHDDHISPAVQLSKSHFKHVDAQATWQQLQAAMASLWFKPIIFSKQVPWASSYLSATVEEGQCALYSVTLCYIVFCTTSPQHRQSIRCTRPSYRKHCDSDISAAAATCGTQRHVNLSPALQSRPL
jgi:hypothetical protein